MASHFTYIHQDLIGIRLVSTLLQLNTKMKFSFFGKKLQHLCSSNNSLLIYNFFHFSFNFNSFFIQLCYFMLLSLFGYLGLKVSKPRTHVRPKDLDLFYTSVSASTVSSMTALEIETFSNSQLILLTILMFLGGEVFISLLELVFARSTQNHSLKNTLRSSNSNKNEHNNNSNTSLSLKQGPPISANHHQIELGLVSVIPHNSENHNSNKLSSVSDLNVVQNGKLLVSFNSRDRIKENSIRYLSHVVFGYLLVFQFVGSVLVSFYVSFIPSARKVLKEKGIKIATFSVFTIVSSFVNCGFVPTNENMIVFKKNSGLLLLIIPHMLFGNTLYPACLRFVIWGLKKITRREEFEYLLKNSKEIGYAHLFSGLHCWLLVATVLGFNLIQFVVFCSMEWKSQIMEGLNPYQKFVASLFQISNARYTGESVFDLSTISAAILVLFIVMMYLPAYTTFLPVKDHENNDAKKEKRISLVESVVLSQLSYLVIFIILICITESKSLREDPLNFNVLNITIEVISAYGNVGFSMGYSCARQLKQDGTCKDLWVGFSGKWSSKGKFIFILIMFFGRLKKFNMNGGKAWDLS